MKIRKKLYTEPELSAEAIARMPEEAIRALCEWPVVNIDVDEFVGKVAAEAALEEDSAGGSSGASSSPVTL